MTAARRRSAQSGFHADPFGPEPKLGACGEIDCSGLSYRTMSGAVVHGLPEQRVVVVTTHCRAFSAHAWNHIGRGSTIHAALDELVWNIAHTVNATARGAA